MSSRGATRSWRIFQRRHSGHVKTLNVARQRLRSSVAHMLTQTFSSQPVYGWSKEVWSKEKAFLLRES